MIHDDSLSNIIDTWKDDRAKKLRSNQMDMKTKIISEFKKISKEELLNKSIDEVYQIVLYDKEESHLYNYSAYPLFEEEISSYLLETLKAFYQEISQIDEDGFNLMTYIEFILNNHSEKYIYWCSYPKISHDIIEEADTYYFTLIRFNKARYERSLSFKEEIHPFINSLHLIWSAQYKEKSYDNAFRKAASNMNDLTGNIWDSVNILSSLKYEGSHNKGSILFIADHTPHLVLELESPVPLSEYRRIRKLLQMSKKGHYLLVNDENIAIGFGTIVSMDPIFWVEFLDHLKWRLYYGQKELMSCTNLLPVLPNTGSDIAKIKGKLSLTFQDVEYDETRILSIIQSAKKQSKGTMIVITEKAETESLRLQSSSIKIKPVKPTTAQTNLITSIDGAVILDPHGYAHAIGSILDGYSTDNGDSSRGARFNSAVRYLNSQVGTKCLIVVISEDRYVDILSTKDI